MNANDSATAVSAMKAHDIAMVARVDPAHAWRNPLTCITSLAGHRLILVTPCSLLR